MEAISIPPQKSSLDVVMHSNGAKNFISVFDQYCIENQLLTEAGTRAIAAAVDKIIEIQTMHQMPVEPISLFLRKVENQINTAVDFPFDLVTIALKILSQPGLPQNIYHDELFSQLVKRLKSYCLDCLFTIKTDNAELHYLSPIFHSFADLVQMISLPERDITRLILLAIAAYFRQDVSPTLQTALSRLIVSIFTRYEEPRVEILNDIFIAIPEGKPQPKYLYSEGERKPISGVTRLLLELPTGFVAFPDDNEKIRASIISDIVNRITYSKFCVKFAEDLAVCLAHPQYPLAFTFVNRLTQVVFSRQETNKTIPSSAKILGILISALSRLHFMPNATIPIPVAISKSLGPAEVEEIELNDDFPQSNFISLFADLIVILPFRQSRDITRCFTALWSLNELNDFELDNMLSWWRGQFPNFSIDPLISERVYIAQIRTSELVKKIQIVYERYLSGLEHKSVTVRSQTLKGFAGIVEQHPDYLFHPHLVPHIADAFLDPSPAIREAVLDIVSKYISKVDQMSSKYFEVIVGRLSDPSLSIVKKALNVIENLSIDADTEGLENVCVLLVRLMNFNDEHDSVSKLAINITRKILFNVSTTPALILSEIMKTGETKWFSSFIKQICKSSKDTEKVRNLVYQTLDDFVGNPRTESLTLVKIFSKDLPRFVAPYFSKLLTLFNAETDQAIISELASTLTPLFNVVDIVNDRQLRDLLEVTYSLILQCRSILLPSIIEMDATAIRLHLFDTTFLDNLFADFLSGIKKNLGNEVELLRPFCGARSIVRFHPDPDKASTFAFDLFKFLNIVFQKHQTDRMARLAIDVASDCIIPNPDLAQKTRPMINLLFNRQKPAFALLFLRSMVDQERDAAVATSFHETRSLATPALIKVFQNEIQKSMTQSDVQVRSAALSLIQSILNTGFGNPMEFMQFILGSLSNQLHDTALSILKTIMSTQEDRIMYRIDEGTKIAQENADGSHQYDFCSVFTLLSPPARKTFIEKLLNQYDKETTNIAWLSESIVRFPFESTKEILQMIRTLTKMLEVRCSDALNDLSNLLLQYANDVSDVECDPHSWISVIFMAKVRDFLKDKYQIPLKDFVIDRKKEKPIKVNIIDTPNFAGLPQLPLKMELCDDLTDFFAYFSHCAKQQRKLKEKLDEIMRKHS